MTIPDELNIVCTFGVRNIEWFKSEQRSLIRKRTRQENSHRERFTDQECVRLCKRDPMNDFRNDNDISMPCLWLPSVSVPNRSLEGRNQNPAPGCAR